MKKKHIILLTSVIMLSLMTGCRRTKEEPAKATTLPPRETDVVTTQQPEDENPIPEYDIVDQEETVSKVPEESKEVAVSKHTEKNTSKEKPVRNEPEDNKTKEDTETIPPETTENDAAKENEGSNEMPPSTTEMPDPAETLPPSTTETPDAVETLPPVTQLPLGDNWETPDL